MKEKFNLSIPQACGENWNSLKVEQDSRFCGKCAASVIDFTMKSETEIVAFFSSRPAKVCGRFRSDQLKSYRKSFSFKQSFLPVRAGALSLVLFLAAGPAIAQGHLILSVELLPTDNSATHFESRASVGDIRVAGFVRSAEDDAPLPGVNIYLKNSHEGTTTDERGYFQFPRKLQEGDVLVFSFIGLETTEFVVTNDLKGDVTITLQPSSIEMMGAVAVEETYTHGSQLRRIWTKIKNVF
jgi:hypothetical protein